MIKLLPLILLFASSAAFSDALTGDVERQPVNIQAIIMFLFCLLYTSPSPRDLSTSRMPSSA